MRDTYKPEGGYADDVHENVPALSEYNGVERHERLGRAEVEELVGSGLVLLITVSPYSEADLLRRKGIG